MAVSGHISSTRNNGTIRHEHFPSNVSQDELRTVLTNLFDENGVDFNAFEQAFANELGSAGSFLDALV